MKLASLTNCTDLQQQQTNTINY